MGQKDWDIIKSVYTVYAFSLALATAGFPTALAKLVSEKDVIGDYKGVHKIFKVSYTVLFITGLVAFCIFFFGAKYIVQLMDNPDAYYAMLAIAPALLFVPIMSSYRGYFQGKKEMTKIAISQISEQFFRVILGLGLAYFLMSKYGPKLGAAGAIAGATVGSIVSTIYLVMIYMGERKQRKVEKKSSQHFKDESVGRILKKFLVIAIPITIGASVMPLVGMIDSLIVIRRLKEAGFTPDQAISMFGQLTSMAMAIINLPSVITIAMSMSLVPSISQSYAIGNKAKARKDTKSAIKVTLLMVLPAAFGIASLATPIINLLYPKEPSTVGTMLFVLAPCVVFLGLMQTMNGILQGMGKPMIPVIALSIGMVFKIIISYTLTGIAEINVFGSALGTVTAYLVAALIEIIYVKKAMNIRFSPKEFIIKPLISVITMFIAVKLSYGLFTGIIGGKIATVIAICVGAAIYGLVIIFIGGIRRDEIVTMPKGEKIYKLLKKINLMR